MRGKLKMEAQGNIYIYIWMFPKIGMGTPQIIYWIIRFFHYKRSILGYPLSIWELVTSCLESTWNHRSHHPPRQDSAERSRALQKRDPGSGRQEGRIKCDQSVGLWKKMTQVVVVWGIFRIFRFSYGFFLAGRRSLAVVGLTFGWILA